MEGMEKSERDFKGIWIPKDIWLSSELSLMEKVLFVEIHSLDNARGCFASNRYFAEFFEVSDRQIRNVIASLKKKGFITITIQNFNDRVIRTAGRHARVPDAAIRQLREDRRQLVDKWSIAARGVGRKVPGR